MYKTLKDSENILIVEEMLSFRPAKRTAHRTLRIGNRPGSGPSLLAGLLFATSAYSVYIRTRYRETPLAVLNLLIFCLAAGCIVMPVIRIHRLNHKIMEFKQQ
jgi:hypothetical protein